MFDYWVHSISPQWYSLWCNSCGTSHVCMWYHWVYVILCSFFFTEFANHFMPNMGFSGDCLTRSGHTWQVLPLISTDLDILNASYREVQCTCIQVDGWNRVESYACTMYSCVYCWKDLWWWPSPLGSGRRGGGGVGERVWPEVNRILGVLVTTGWPGVASCHIWRSSLLLKHLRKFSGTP